MPNTSEGFLAFFSLFFIGLFSAPVFVFFWMCFDHPKKTNRVVEWLYKILVATLSLVVGTLFTAIFFGVVALVVAIGSLLIPVFGYLYQVVVITVSPVVVDFLRIYGNSDQTAIKWFCIAFPILAAAIMFFTSMRQAEGRQVCGWSNPKRHDNYNLLLRTEEVSFGVKGLVLIAVYGTIATILVYWESVDGKSSYGEVAWFVWTVDAVIPLAIRDWYCFRRPLRPRKDDEHPF